MKEQISFIPKDIRTQEFGGKNVEFKVFKEFVTPFTGSNILFATTESGLSVAIKISKKRGGARREWEGLNKAHKAGVPVPTPLALVEDFQGIPALVTPKIEGELLYFHPDDQVKGELGKIVKYMHNEIEIDDEEKRIDCFGTHNYKIAQRIHLNI